MGLSYHTPAFSRKPKLGQMLGHQGVVIFTSWSTGVT